MNPAKIIEREIQAHHCVEVLPLLTESIRQSREPTHTHADGEIASLNN